MQFGQIAEILVIVQTKQLVTLALQKKSRCLQMCAIIVTQSRPISPRGINKRNIQKWISPCKRRIVLTMAFPC